MSARHDTAEKILDAASSLFATRGYAATTTKAIAEAAGVNEVTIFRNFENKLGVLKALGERLGRRQAGRAAAAAPPSENVRETLLGFARMEIAGALEDGGLAMRLAYDSKSVPEIAELMGEGVPGNLKALSEYFAEQQTEGALRSDIHPEVMAEAFFGLTSSYVMYRQLLGAAAVPADVGTDEGIEQLFDLFWSGAAAK